jgi:hypothetical protein
VRANASVRLLWMLARFAAARRRLEGSALGDLPEDLGFVFRFLADPLPRGLACDATRALRPADAREEGP